MGLLISPSHKFIFVHVPKTAGSSITSALRTYAANPDEGVLKRLLGLFRLSGRHRRYVYGKFRPHTKAAALTGRVPAEVLNGYYKFAFVRNPWDWHVSWYHYILKRPRSPFHTLVKSFSGLGEFIRYQVEHSKFQYDWIHDRQGNRLVDFVGYYERLADDFRHVCGLLNIKAELPHRNPSRHENYRTYYDAATRKLVEEHYRKDIETFGYTFEGLAPGRAA